MVLWYLCEIPPPEWFCSGFGGLVPWLLGVGLAGLLHCLFFCMLRWLVARLLDSFRIDSLPGCLFC